jgi:hypothetical protein
MEISTLFQLYVADLLPSTLEIMYALTHVQLYILQYFTPDILAAFVGQHPAYYTDFHKLFVEYAKKALCNVPIHTSAEVRCVDRSGDKPIITYTKPNTNGSYITWNKQECSSVIFAFPPSIGSLERAGVDITEQEHDALKNVTTHQYYSAAVELKLPFGVSYIANATSPVVPPPNEGQPIAVLHLSEKSNVSVSWSWGPYEYQTEEAARKILIDSLSKVNKDPRNGTESSQPRTATSRRSRSGTTSLISDRMRFATVPTPSSTSSRDTRRATGPAGSAAWRLLSGLFEAARTWSTLISPPNNIDIPGPWCNFISTRHSGEASFSFIF